MAVVFGYPRYSFSDLFAPSRGYQYVNDPYFVNEPCVHVSAPVSKVHVGAPVPKVHVEEEENGWIVKVSLPGIKSNQHIKIRIETNNTLKITANDGYRNYAHRIAIPEGTNFENISAEFESQILTVLIPRKDKEEIEIEVTKKETQKREEEEAKKKQEENAKKLALFRKILSGPKITFSKTETHNFVKFDFGDVINKENVDIQVLGNQLTVSVKTNEEQLQYNFQKTVALPDNVKEDQISASIEGTTLAISFPKEEAKKPFKIAITDANTTSKTESEAAPVESETTTTETVSNESTSRIQE